MKYHGSDHQGRCQQEGGTGGEDGGAGCGEGGEGRGHGHGGNDHRDGVERGEHALQFALRIVGGVARQDGLDGRGDHAAQCGDRGEHQGKRAGGDQAKRRQGGDIDPHAVFGGAVFAKASDQWADKERLPQGIADAVNRQ